MLKFKFKFIIRICNKLISGWLECIIIILLTSLRSVLWLELMKKKDKKFSSLFSQISSLTFNDNFRPI